MHVPPPPDHHYYYHGLRPCQPYSTLCMLNKIVSHITTKDRTEESFYNLYCQPTSMSSGCFLDLPSEILNLVCLRLNPSSLKEFSLVDRRCRVLSIPILFHTIHVSFSSSGLDSFRAFSYSHLASQVQILCYDVSEIIDPCMSLPNSWFVILMLMI